MRNVVKAIVTLLCVLSLDGCAGPTAITDLALPPVSTIEGKITQLDESGFMLTDSSGSIYVRAKLPDSTKLKLALLDSVRVYVNLRGGEDKIFDGYVIKKSTGEQVIISTPTPHFGCIIQSAFK